MNMNRLGGGDITIIDEDGGGVIVSLYNIILMQYTA